MYTKNVVVKYILTTCNHIQHQMEPNHPRGYTSHAFLPRIVRMPCIRSRFLCPKNNVKVPTEPRVGNNLLLLDPCLPVNKKN
jgi:hypothetical protein